MRLLPAFLLPAVLLCAGCQSARRPAMTPAQRADYDACRKRVDQVFQQQNRAALSERDGRDEPFSNRYDSGITSAGLSSRYARDNLLQTCTPGQQAVDDGTGPTFAGPKSR